MVAFDANIKLLLVGTGLCKMMQSSVMARIGCWWWWLLLLTIVVVDPGTASWTAVFPHGRVMTRSRWHGMRHASSFFVVTAKIPPPLTSTSSRPSLLSLLSLSSSSSSGVDEISLRGWRVSDHEQVGQELAESVQRWLDTEFMTQDIHNRIGQSCGASYVECRQQQQDEYGNRRDDLMSIMMVVADNLQQQWQEYDQDAFVNAWDVANYVSDYLIAAAGLEGCACSSRIY